MTTDAEGVKKAVKLEELFGTELLLAESGPRQADGGEPGRMTLEDIEEHLGECTRCALHEGRNKIVFGEGSSNARAMFIGEGPGAEEDRQGRPFVGRAGKMLTAIIENVLFLTREDVYIANIVKCRPPGNRNPLPDECAACKPFLFAQIEAIQPEVIVALGGVATHNLLETKVPISRLRGRLHTWGTSALMPTYHPAYLLRNPSQKRKVFEDMIIVRDRLGITPPQE